MKGLTIAVASVAVGFAMAVLFTASAFASDVDAFRGEQICNAVRQTNIPQFPMGQIRKEPEIAMLIVQCGILAATQHD